MRACVNRNRGRPWALSTNAGKVCHTGKFAIDFTFSETKNVCCCLVSQTSGIVFDGVCLPVCLSGRKSMVLGRNMSHGKR